MRDWNSQRARFRGGVVGVLVALALTAFVPAGMSFGALGEGEPRGDEDAVSLAQPMLASRLGEDPFTSSIMQSGLFAMREALPLAATEPTLGWEQFGTCEWQIDDEGCLTIRPLGNGGSGTLEFVDTQGSYYKGPWYSRRNEIVSIRIAPGVSAKGGMNEIFYDYENLTSIDLSCLNITAVTDLSGLFGGCSSLQSVDFSGLDASSVEDMSHMLSGCSSLRSIDFSADFSSVRSVFGLLAGCTSLEYADLTGFDAAQIGGPGYVFGLYEFVHPEKLRTVKLSAESAALGKSLSEVGTIDGHTGRWASNADGRAYEPSAIPSDVAATYTLQTFDMVGESWNVIGTCEWTIDEDGLLTIRPLYNGESGEFDLPRQSIDVTPPTSWRECPDLIVSAVVQDGVKSGSCLAEMFKGCERLVSADLSRLDALETSDAHFMFGGCASLASVDLPNMNLSSVGVDGLFSGCESLVSVDFSGVSYDGVPICKTPVFYDCTSLRSITVDEGSAGFAYWLPSPSGEGFTGRWVCSADGRAYYSSQDYRNQSAMPTDLTGMYTAQTVDQVNSHWNQLGTCEWRIDDENCLVIRPLHEKDSGTLDDLTYYGGSPWYLARNLVHSVCIEEGVKAASNLAYLFQDCYNLIAVEGLSNLDTSNTANFSGMFSDCDQLVSIEGLESLDTPAATSMQNMFSNCKSLTSLSFDEFETSNVTDMSFMFSGCNSLTNLDLSMFDTSCVKNFTAMFQQCGSLESLDLSSFDTRNADKLESMMNFNSDSLRSITVGEHFSFYGLKTIRQCSFPEPPLGYMQGFTGLWKSSVDGKTYDNDAIPDCVAATYTPDREDGYGIYDLSGATFEPIPDQEYTGEPLTPTFIVTLNGVQLHGFDDYLASYRNNTYPGTATLTITGVNKYEGKASTTFRIIDGGSLDPQPISIVKPTGKALSYSGLEQVGVVESEGYALSGVTKAKAAGTYSATAALRDGYVWSDGTSGDATVTWSIAKKTLIAAYESEEIAAEEEPAGIVVVSGFVEGESPDAGNVDGYIAPTVSFPTLSPGASYRLSPSGGKADNYEFKYVEGTLTVKTADQGGAENPDPGTGGGSGSEGGGVPVPTPINIASASVEEIPDQVLSEEADAPCPKPVVTLDGKMLVEGVDYSLSYIDNDKPGTAYAVILGLGSYAGELRVAFTVLEPEGSELLPVPDFEDCIEGAWYTEWVDYAVSHGLMTGDRNPDGTYTTFRPEEPISRAQVATILYRHAHPDAVDTTEPESYAQSNLTGLSDVLPGQYYTAAINWAKDAGIVTGYDAGEWEGTFRPDVPVTREELAAMIARYAASFGEDVLGADPSALESLIGWEGAQSFALEALAWCCDEGIIGGVDNLDGTFSLEPQGDALRAAAAKMLTVLDRDVLGETAA